MKRKLYKILLLAVYTASLIPIGLFFSFGIYMSIHDVFSGNGYRPVFATAYDGTRELVIYRTPDLGALGGDYLEPAIVSPVLPGVVKRDFLPSGAMTYGRGDAHALVDTQTGIFRVPPPAELQTDDGI